MWALVFVLLSKAAAPHTKYTNRPLNGYFCNANFLENATDVSQHQCVHRCLSNSQCTTLSYNPVGRYCLLASERCPSATLHPEFMLMVFRETERHPNCISWIRRDEAATDRILTATMGHPYELGRLSEGNDQIPGFVRYGRLFIADLNTNRERWVREYSVLVVSPSCTLAWVPYKAGDSLPNGAQQAGVLNGVALYSIMVPLEEHGLQRFGFHVVGEGVGRYGSYGDIYTTTDMYILVPV